MKRLAPLRRLAPALKPPCLVCGREGKKQQLPSGVEAPICDECRGDRYRVPYAETWIRELHPELPPTEIRFPMGDKPHTYAQELARREKGRGPA